MMTDLEGKLLSLPACPVCRSTDRKKLFDLKIYRVFECRGCRLRYIDPCLSPEGMKYFYASSERLLELNPFHESYYDYGDPAVPSQTVRDFERVLAVLEASGSVPERSVFDVGCGNGLFLAVARKRGWRVGGCEPGEKSVALARTKFGIEVRHSGFDDLALTGEKYDALSFWDVMEHLTDPHAFIRKAAEMLKPEGRIVVGGPNDRSFLRLMAATVYLLTAGRVSSPLRKVYLLEHVAYYTGETLKRLFAQHGFVLRNVFLSSTDLNKYHFSVPEKILASAVLGAGKVTGLQNRVVTIFQSPS